MLVESVDKSIWCELSFADPYFRGVTLKQLESGGKSHTQFERFKLHGKDDILVSLRLGGSIEFPEFHERLEAKALPNGNIITLQSDKPFKSTINFSIPNQFYLKDIREINIPEDFRHLISIAFFHLLGYN